MKCLVIATDIAKTAPGIVYETIIRELAKTNELTLISPDIKADIEQLPVKILPSVKYGFRHWRIERISMSLLGYNILDYKWFNRQKKLLKADDMADVDIIISCASNFNYIGMILGFFLARKYNKKWVIYSVDAIPAPLEWLPNKRLYNNTKKFISKYISLCDAFFSSNEQMLKYQLSMVPSFDKISGVVLNPIRKKEMLDLKSNSSIPVFLYTGGLYGPRNINALMDGFRLFLKDYPEAKIIFVGDTNSKYYDAYLDLQKSGNMEVLGYTDDLMTLYKRATVLIDINSYYDNDVFLSSKIVNYLPLKRPIISITGKNSPARNIFTSDPSIIHCQHNEKEIYDTMCNIKNICVDNVIREKYIKMFSVENALLCFNEFIGNV